MNKYKTVEDAINYRWSEYDITKDPCSVPTFGSLIGFIAFKTLYDDVNLNSVINMIKSSFRQRRIKFK